MPPYTLLAQADPTILRIFELVRVEYGLKLEKVRTPWHEYWRKLADFRFRLARIDFDEELWFKHLRQLDFDHAPDLLLHVVAERLGCG